MTLINKVSRLFALLYQKRRISFYKIISDSSVLISGRPIVKQPVHIVGKGKIMFGQSVQLGFFPSPGYYNGIIYLEARNEGSEIVFGNNLFINNGLVIICDKTRVSIRNKVLIGFNVEMIDSDFHGLNPKERLSTDYSTKEIIIEENVFIGNNVKILKGVVIGCNSVIANGSIVTKSIPANVIAGGNPAVVIKQLSSSG